MNLELRDLFTRQWQKYFGDAELPITFYYSKGEGGAEKAVKPKGRSCLICELAKVRNGKSLFYNVDNVTCMGGRRYLGFNRQMRAGFEYFLSCGNESMEGERYKRTPELVVELMKNQEFQGKEDFNIIFKRWDHLGENDRPEVVIFFAKPDVLSGLFTLSNFDQIEPNGVIAPFGAGCGSIVHHPYLESQTENPRAVIGMFDPSARPCVPEYVLTFSIPMQKFEKMIGFMDESFLITPTWSEMRKRIQK
jgi:uncharacterized protein (DUF169 family)